MKQTIFICVIVAVVFLLIGRLTAVHPSGTLMEDSLRRDIRTRVVREAMWMDSAASAHNRAEFWKAKAEKSQEVKVITKKIYVKELSKIDLLPDSTLAAAISARYHNR